MHRHFVTINILSPLICEHSGENRRFYCKRLQLAKWRRIKRCAFFLDRSVEKNVAEPMFICSYPVNL